MVRAPKAPNRKRLTVFVLFANLNSGFNWLYTSVHYLASSLVLAFPLGLLPWLLPARASRSLSSMSPPRGALVVLLRPVLVLL